MVNVGDNVTCLCQGKRGFPPVSVTWYKDGSQIGDIKKERNALTLIDIDKNHTGMYKCTGKSLDHTEEKTVEIRFYGKSTNLFPVLQIIVYTRMWKQIQRRSPLRAIDCFGYFIIFDDFYQFQHA